MAVWYWDPVNGNNANDGTTFANRKLNLQNLTTATAGDTIRCIASPAPTNTGINATWTDGSNTVTLASAQTQIIASCDTNWTSTTNTTCATSIARKEGTNSVTNTISSTFTTGKASYFATGTLNCSGYQQLTFWMMQSSGTLAVSGDYTMSLCSDTLGVTRVNDFPIPAIGALGQWFPVTINLGTNLGASIQSIAFYVNVDRAAVTFQFDNINVALAPTNAASITTTSLISKNTTNEAWFGIRSINGTTVILDDGPSYTLNMTGTDPLYSGVTETVALWKRETLKTIQQSINSNYVNYYAGGTGTNVAGVIVSGGWNSTDMSTQTGQTYLDGQNGNGYGLSLTNGTLTMSYLTFSNINTYRYYIGLTSITNYSSSNNTIIADNSNNNNNGGVGSPTASYHKNYTFTVTNIVKNGYSDLIANAGLSLGNGCSTSCSTISVVNCNSNWGSGMLLGASTTYFNTISITNCNRNTMAGVLLISTMANTLTLGALLGNGISPNYTYFGQIHLEYTAAVYTPGQSTTTAAGCHDNIINVGNITWTANNTPGIFFSAGTDNNKIVMTGVFTGFTNTSRPCIASWFSGSNYLTSANAVFATGIVWTQIGGNAKIYISTADTLAPSLNTANYAPAMNIVKNSYGIPNQTYILPQYWGAQ